jgi:hypothetical protein
MNEGISLDQACEMRALNAEDFARSCNEDGTVRGNTDKTTFTLKSDNSKSVTLDNTAIQAGIITAVLIVLIMGIFLIRKLRKIK